MGPFLIIPAIARENLDPCLPMKKGLTMMRIDSGLFGSGFAIIHAAVGIICLPTAIDY